MENKHPRFFFDINNSTFPQNELEKEINNQFSRLEGTLLINRNLFFSELKQMLDKINEKYKSCKPLRIESDSQFFNEFVIYVFRQNGSHLMFGRMIKITNDLTHLPPENSEIDA